MSLSSVMQGDAKVQNWQKVFCACTWGGVGSLSMGGCHSAKTTVQALLGRSLKD